MSGMKSIMDAPGKVKRSYASGHVFKCFKCELWVRYLRDNEMCNTCNKANGIKETPLQFIKINNAGSMEK